MIQLKNYLIFVILLLAILSAGSVSASATNLRITINGAVPKVLGWDGKQFFGTYSSLLECIMSRMPYQFDISMVPVARLELLLQKGATDLAFVLSQTKERDQFSEFSESIFASRFILYVRPTSNITKDNLSSLTIATVRGSVFEYEIEENLKAISQGVSSWGAAFLMLQSGRVDGVYTADIIAAKELENPSLLNGLDQLEINQHLVGAYISKSAPDKAKILQNFNLALGQCQPNTRN